MDNKLNDKNNKLILFNSNGVSPNSKTRRDRTIIDNEFSDNSYEKESESEDDHSEDSKNLNDIYSNNSNCNNNKDYLYKKNNIFNYKKEAFISSIEFDDCINNSSEENNDIYFKRNKQLIHYNNNFTTPYFSKSKISDMDDNDILNIFDSFDLIIYTDDYKLRNRNCNDLFGFFTRKKYISESDLPGIAFISVDVI